MVSTASNHSQRSDNSYDYLSVEEKECLMFLEETIGSLDTEADSGVSTDDTDYVEPSKPPGMWPRRDSVSRELENGAPPPNEMAKEDRLDQANTRSQKSSLGSLIIQPPDPFRDDLVSHEWARSSRSGAKGETAKETKSWLSWGQPEKSTLEEAPQDPDAKRGPPTAPKPRKLPPNIILKTSKNSPGPLAMEPGQKANSGHLDPKEREKVRQQALEKLGLSQDRRELRTHLQPTTHPQPHEMPSPAPGEPEVRCGVAERSVPGVRQMNFKSNTLERSGVGLSSYMASTKEQSVKTSSSLGKMSFIERLAPSFLRSSRPRPVSLAVGKDFAGLKEPRQAEPEKSSKQRSQPTQSFPRPPRSCVSVKISPKGATDENRREALKKLGLLKE
ncbi:PREDICTED: specifically androgen-regulated gene protein [Pterocles gutturalis]|uniref:specifically androgen-regulated gene protein n=1 Tax=Pterocles gutturalis TaxID=240206 RepID=UPI000528F234|nr:PREDICTED: specifically androgen-regulated gene protein [Pterocles gutturalis]